MGLVQGRFFLSEVNLPLDSGALNRVCLPGRARSLGLCGRLLFSPFVTSTWILDWQVCYDEQPQIRALALLQTLRTIVKKPRVSWQLRRPPRTTRHLSPTDQSMLIVPTELFVE